MRKTERSTIWVDKTWTIRTEPVDQCQGNTAPAWNSDTASFFRCGSNAAGLFNCHRADGSTTVTCISDHRKKEAVRFTTHDSELYGAPFESALPIEIELDDGTHWFPLMHRQGLYYENRTPGLRCDDESVILDDGAVAQYGGERYIDPSSAVFTVQRARGRGRPTTQAVRRVIWVALPGEEPFYWG